MLGLLNDPVGEKEARGAMPFDEDITYWAARAEEERRIAASLPDGPAALVHQAMAELYERATLQRKQPRYGLSEAKFCDSS